MNLYSRSRVASACLAALTLVILGVAPSRDALAAGAFATLSGSWHGTGRVQLANGGTERLRCRGYYNVKDSGAGLGFAIRCASPDSKIELRARLHDSGGRLSGTWEERNFNATGNVSGTAHPSRMDLRINGAVNGSVLISVGEQTHQVSISTGERGLRGIAISFRR